MLIPTRCWLLLLLISCLGLLPAGKAWAQIYYLKLDHDTIALANRVVRVEQVLDGRPGHPTIGLVYRGLGNRPAAVLFRKGLETELTDFLHQQLPARPTDHPIVLCLRQLRISEVLNGLTEDASADLAADLYLQQPDGYHFVRSVAACTQQRALETTALHSAHIALLLQQCLEQLSPVDWAQLPPTPARSLQQLPNDVPMAVAATGARVKRPAILREKPRSGIFYSFEQFVANRPDTTLHLSSDTLGRLAPGAGPQHWAGVVRYRPAVVNEKGRRTNLTKSAWGYCDGQRLFVQHKGSYFPLVRQADFFTFIGEKPLDVEYMRARSDAQARAMVVGVARVNSAEPDHRGEPTPYALDMRTGQVAPYPDPLRPAPLRLDTAYVYLYRRADASPTPVPVYLEGRKIAQLQPNEYLVLPWPYYARMMRLCVDVGTPFPCQLLVPDTSAAGFLKINPDSAAEPWQWVDAQQGQRDLDALDSLQAAPRKDK
jgi:hypothetical protein